MKKLINLNFILTLSVFFTVNQSQAQKSYISLNAGMAYSMSSQTMDGFHDYKREGNFMDGYTLTEEQIYLSLGKGFNAGIAFGHMFNKNLGAELGISFLKGGKTVSKWSEQQFDISEYETTISANMFRFIPSLIITAGKERINPYAKFGLMIGKGTIYYDLLELYNDETISAKMKLNGGIAIGINSALGVMLKISDKFSCFGEINSNNLSYSPTKGKFTEYNYNGRDYVDELETSEKEVRFVDKYTYDSNNPPSDSEPSEDLKMKFPFGSIGFNFGVMFRF